MTGLKGADSDCENTSGVLGNASNKGAFTIPSGGEGISSTLKGNDKSTSTNPTGPSSPKLSSTLNLSTIQNSNTPSIPKGTSGTFNGGLGSSATPKPPSGNISKPNPGLAPSIGGAPPPVPPAPTTTKQAPSISIVILSVELATAAALPPGGAGNSGTPSAGGPGNATTSSELEDSRRKRHSPQLHVRQNDSPTTPDPDSSSGFVGNVTAQNPSECTDANLFIRVSISNPARNPFRFRNTPPCPIIYC